MEEVLRAREDLWKSVDRVPDEVLRRPNDKGWSILFVLEHLHLSEQLITGVIKESLLKPPVSEALQQDPLEPIRNRKNKFVAAESLTPTGQFHSINETRQKLSQSREQLVAVISSANSDTLRTHGAAVPGLGMLTTEQWLQFACEHERRHIAQIEDMKTV